MSCLVEEYFINGYKISHSKSNTYSLNKYLKEINFMGHWKNDSNTIFSLPQKKQTTLQLSKIEPGFISQYVQVAQKYFEDNYFAGYSLEPLNIALAELFNNIFDHAKSPVSGFTISQYYPNLEQIIISVCDLGIGIPTAVNNFKIRKGEPIVSPLECMRLALKKGFTASEHINNKGFGLDTLKNIVLNCGGELNFISNEAFVKIRTDEQEFHELQNSFPGTLVYCKLDTGKLELKDEEVIDSDFIL